MPSCTVGVGPGMATKLVVRADIVDFFPLGHFTRLSTFHSTCGAQHFATLPVVTAVESSTWVQASHWLAVLGPISCCSPLRPCWGAGAREGVTCCSFRKVCSYICLYHLSAYSLSVCRLSIICPSIHHLYICYLSSLFMLSVHMSCAAI